MPDPTIWRPSCLKRFVRCRRANTTAFGMSLAAACAPRRPEQSLLNQLVARHLEAFFVLERVRYRVRSDSRALPEFWSEALSAFPRLADDVPAGVA